MQLSKAEVASSDIIVTTPEKFDVVTRKSGDGSLCQVSYITVTSYASSYALQVGFITLHCNDKYFH